MKTWMSVGLSVLLSACSSEQEVKVYRVAKSDHKEQESLFQQEIPKASVKLAEIVWEAPKHWQEQPAFGMRYGSFSTKEGLDISVIFLEGAAGGDLANVNRWRQQINLPPWNDKELNENMSPLENALGQVKMWDFSSQEDSRVLAALIPYKHGTWFFKMKGKSPLVEQEKTPFVSFVRSVR